MKESITHFRAFNRFYTPILGLLNRHYLNSTFSLSEVRILFELHYAPKGLTAKDLTARLHLDKGYLSRILLEFQQKKLICKTPSDSDGRSLLLRLTETGRTVFRGLDKASEQQATRILRSLTDTDVNSLISHMKGIQNILQKIKFSQNE